MQLYSEIFIENLIIGVQVGSGVVISGILTKFIPLYEFPFYNRAAEVGVFNNIQNEYVNKGSISCSILDFTANFIYRGAFQGVKWLPNLWIQNQAKEYFSASPAKAFLIPLTGMIPFFTIGAVEAIMVKDKTSKLIFTFTSAAILATIPSFYGVEETIKTKVGAIHLSPQDTYLAQEGLIISYLLMDIFHLCKIPGMLKSVVDLPKLTVSVLIINEAYNSITLSDSANNILTEAMKIVAFSLAKAVAVTSVQIVSDLVITTPMVVCASYASIVTMMLYEGYNLTINNEVALHDALYTSITEIAEISAVPVMMMGINYLAS